MIVFQSRSFGDLTAAEFSATIHALRADTTFDKVMKGYGMPDDLTPVQRSVLLVLMAEAREMSNADLTKIWNLELKKNHRDDLEKRGFIAVRTENRRKYLDLAGEGPRWCQEQLGAELPGRMGHAGAAAYALLGAIGRYLDRTGGSLTAFVARTEEPPEPALVEPAPVTGTPDLEALIRKAYQELSTLPGDWVKLAELRPRLGGADRAAVDQVLIALNQAPDVSIEPQSNQLSLTEQDRAAAVWIGNEAKHVIAIGQS